MKAKQVNFRPSEQALKNLQTIQEISGANKTSAIEMSVGFFATVLEKGDIEMKNIEFAIPTDPDYYGSEFTEHMIDEFENFTKSFLKSIGYNAHTFRAQALPHNDDCDLRLKVWTAFCGS